MPSISVIIPTNRVGGFDLTLSSLCRQTFKDFEVIIVDSIHEYRRKHVIERLNGYPFRIKYVEPLDNPFPIQAYCRCMNTGLMHVESEITYITADYAFLAEDCLRLHHEEQRAAGVPTAIIGSFQTSHLPPLHESFPRSKYSSYDDDVLASWSDVRRRTALFREWSRNYVRDLEAGVLDRVMFSTFAREWTPDDDASELLLRHQEHKLAENWGEGWYHPKICFLKNDSFPTALFFAINGFDEDFDGGHDFQNSDMASRLSYLNVPFIYRRKPLVTFADMHEHIIMRRAFRQEDGNHELYKMKHEGDGKRLIWANTSFSLWDEHERHLPRRTT